MLQGLAHGLKIKGSGTMTWSVTVDTGQDTHESMPAYYVPSTQCHLLHLQNYLQDLDSANGQKEEYFIIHVKQFALFMPDGRTATIIYDKQINLPTVSMWTNKASDSGQRPIDIMGLKPKLDSWTEGTPTLAFPSLSSRF